MRAIARALLAIGMLAAAGTAAASSISVAPIRVELSAAKRTAVLTVRNQEDAPVIVQARPAA
jgi:fimbrial chaperone protein